MIFVYIEYFSMANICRLCLNIFTTKLNTTDWNNGITLESQIRYLLPEVDITITSELILCCGCLESLCKAYKFKYECLQVECVIQRYLSQQSNNLPIDLKYVITYIDDNELKPDINYVNREQIDRLLFNTNNNEDEKSSRECLDKDLVQLENIDETKLNFRCDKCEKIFFEEEGFNQHKGVCIFSKYDCYTKVIQQNQIKDHVGNQNKSKKFMCEICSKTFKNESALKYHTQTHMECNPQVCQICSKIFATEKLLKIHKAIHKEKEKIHHCNICNKNFYKLSKLKIHQSTHTEELQYKCTICEKSFKIMSYLQRHVTVQHLGIQKYVCDVCGMKCKSRSNLLEHLRTHTGEKPFKCEICGKGFAQRGTLMVHVRSIHSKEKPFECETCGRTFTLKGNLKAHLAIHMENLEKKYVCTKCNKCFRINKDLQRHIQRHLGVKTHTCPICNKGFIGSTAVKIHIRSHTGERPYECDICNKNFSQKYNLQIHLKSHKSK